MNDFSFCYKLQSTRKLISDFKGFGFGDGTSLADDVLKVAIRAKLEYHYNVMFSQETIIDSGCEKAVYI